jgi:hypothetical protein
MTLRHADFGYGLARAMGGRSVTILSAVDGIDSMLIIALLAAAMRV